MVCAGECSSTLWRLDAVRESRTQGLEGWMDVIPTYTYLPTIHGLNTIRTTGAT